MDEVSTRLWAGARSGRLELQRCKACGHLRFFPSPICPVCLAEEGEWTELSGAGRVYSFTWYTGAPSDRFAAFVPYAIALVDLQEGPRVMARLHLNPAQPLAVGDPLVFRGSKNDGEGDYLVFSGVELAP